MRRCQIAVLIISVLMIVFGAFRGEIAIILQKATQICMECIGLG